ncbi:hypothetical protein N7510_007877 [Penicillium lagena]|uniref:uncharacterized protein n=1 Tax=Penicillium lagena TaxID=94218 RepID=UPI00254238F8|nr:uncharacterized protein N7510_007877 [Penicillium lagena]KAJ5611158.1 hypothetical protein N7510_007877 [Penicillium lagena]
MVMVLRRRTACTQDIPVHNRSEGNKISAFDGKYFYPYNKTNQLNLNPRVIIYLGSPDLVTCPPIHSHRALALVFGLTLPSLVVHHRLPASCRVVEGISPSSPLPDPSRPPLRPLKRPTFPTPGPPASPLCRSWRCLGQRSFPSTPHASLSTTAFTAYQSVTELGFLVCCSQSPPVNVVGARALARVVLPGCAFMNRIIPRIVLAN